MLVHTMLSIFKENGPRGSCSGSSLQSTITVGRRKSEGGSDAAGTRSVGSVGVCGWIVSKLCEKCNGRKLSELSEGGDA